MASVNKIILIGNLGNDPQIREGDHVIANLSLGTSRKWRDKDGNVQQETEWHRICAFGRLAEIIRDYTAKGDPPMSKVVCARASMRKTAQNAT